MDLFGGRTPALRSLYLGGFAVDLRSSIFKNLTEIYLEQGMYEGTRPSCEELVDALAVCPALQVLTLEMTCPAPCVGELDNMMFANTQPHMCRLPDLREISIRDNASHCAHFLGHIDYPQSAIARFTIIAVLGNYETPPYHRTLAPIGLRYQDEGCLQDLDIYYDDKWKEMHLHWTHRPHGGT